MKLEEKLLLSFLAGGILGAWLGFGGIILVIILTVIGFWWWKS